VAIDFEGWLLIISVPSKKTWYAFLFWCILSYSKWVKCNALLISEMEAKSSMSNPENIPNPESTRKPDLPEALSSTANGANLPPGNEFEPGSNTCQDHQIQANSIVADKGQATPAAFKKGIVREVAEFVIHTVIMGLFGITFVMQFVNIPSGSMLNTIQVGDRLIVNKFLFGNTMLLRSLLPQRSVRRGDIIVFKYPVDPKKSYVKRVIGLPGETVELRGNRVFINGKELPETRTLIESPLDDADPLIPNLTLLATLTPPDNPNPTTYTTYYLFSEAPEVDSKLERSLMGQKFALQQPFLVPAGHYFVMGDNRDNSQDSRYWGAVPQDYIIGSATLVFWSRAAPVALESEMKIHVSRQPPPWSEQVRWKRIGTVLR
jgi:signal peptidase I